ncbi:peptide/nickel transport system ATP-binding protein [Geobacter argillaceus]|uniref:Peptide/nickel transport system ATP-binding protein n=1 Tax=Geobacter argillaceus TaxID=345631 RepID=A0A562WQX3_9BACT|nr:peptide/nickel transport system ATP-binding protein [Geobacter argillaceus]
MRPTLSSLLEVKQLATHYILPRSVVKAVDRIDFSLNEGETLALVGESGCGKSATAYSIMGLVSPPGRIVAGEILFQGTDLCTISPEELRQLRGDRLAMIFQEPMTSLNPVLTTGFQIAEGLRLHRGLSAKEARGEAVRLLDQVGIPAPVERYNAYPHQMSGGMKQRVMIAMALACRPRLLIADEPTTALDVTIQAQILELIDQLKQQTGMSLLLITHDLGIVAERAHATAIMYAGRIVEQGSTKEILTNPLHPYTRGLLASLPQGGRPGEPLATIAGQVPSLSMELPGCGFCDRCPDPTGQCRVERPPVLEPTPGHRVSCWKCL